MQRYPEAEKYFKKVMDLDPAAGTFPMLYLAKIALLDQRKSDAVAWIRIFLRLHPNYPEAAYWAETLQKLESGDANNASVIASHTLKRP